MRRRWFTGMTGWWLTAGIALATGPFPLPKDGPLPFRRDRLPLDADTLRGLSKELVLLGRSLDGELPEQRHTAAQALALALALDPVNLTAREALESYSEGKPAGEKTLPSVRFRLLASWLGSAGAGKDGQALAACLRDVVTGIESAGDPPTQEGAWNGWVPGLEAFRPVEVASDEPKVEAPPTTSVESVLARRQGAIFALLPVGNSFQKVKIVLKELPPREGQEAESLQMEAQGSNLGETGKMLTSVVAGLHDKPLPVARLGLSFEKHGSANRSDPGFSAAALVLMDAAVSGREPSGLVIGRIDKSGKLLPPPHLANRLLALVKGEGGRVILPHEAEPLLISIAVLAGPEFLLKHEVIYASNARELVERATSKPDGAAGEAMALFGEIRAKAGDPANAGAYLANRFVRQKLAEVYQKFPDHASARLLWKQGGGEMPLKLVRPVLAAEISRSLDALTWLTALEASGTVQVPKLEQAQEACRNEIERLGRYVGSEDKALLDGYRALLQAIRGYAREVRERNGNSGYYYYEEGKLENALREMKDAYRNYRDELAKISE